MTIGHADCFTAELPDANSDPSPRVRSRPMIPLVEVGYRRTITIGGPSELLQSEDPWLLWAWGWCPTGTTVRRKNV